MKGLILLFLISILLFSGIYFAGKVSKPINSVEVPAVKTTIVPTGQVAAGKRLQLVNTTTRRSATLLSLCIDCEGNNLKQIKLWRNWLVYSGYENEKIYIKAFDLLTKKEQLIFTPEVEVFTKNNLDANEVTDFQIIDDTLYFSLGGYLRSGGILWVRLPPVTKPQLLTKSRNAELVNWKGKTWLVGGEGDACWSKTGFSLVDLSTKKATEIATSIKGCAAGEKLIDLDKRNRVIMAYHTAGEDNGDDNNGVYQYIKAVSLANPTITEEIISKQNMPDGITDIKYDANADKLYLYGKSIYEYSFVNKIIKVSGSKPNIPEIVVPKTEMMSISEQVKSIVLPEGYDFVEAEK